MDILEKIVNKKKIYLENLKQKVSYKTLRENVEKSYGSRTVINFYNALKDYEKISIIAEVKKASPSKGLIRPDMNHIQVAQEYLKSDVQAMSVLTETDFFLGQPEFLSDIRKISNIPLLRKDFVIDDYQIYEAYLLGADAVLLIAAILDDKTLSEFKNTAESLGLKCLVEVHDSEELKRVLDIGADIVGVNNRNLKTFDVDLHTTEKLIEALSDRDNKTVVSESGIKNGSDLKYLDSLGVDAVLIGETFMRQNNVSKAVEILRHDML
ncbi:MAG: indole-3-glycerol phosphate synthase TrpC [Clostridiales bacterium]|nr:indole-3-glycerol phosphate synthase TrpC [Clostridiales bacterium]